MGLDMYAFSLPSEGLLDTADVDFARDSSVKPVELAYWRKHHDLHGWMANLYREKGGTDPMFNCNEVRLSAHDLTALEEAIKQRKLPATAGFFFGSNPPDNESDTYDLDFIEKARQALAEGAIVFYTSWW